MDCCSKYFCTIQPELEKSAADIKIEEINQYVTQLEKQLAGVTRNAENLVKRSRELSLAFFEFGQSFSFMGQQEGDTVGSALSEVYMSLVYLIDICLLTIGAHIDCLCTTFSSALLLMEYPERLTCSQKTK